ncbi:MAG: TolC family protein [Crocinitomicaceae bacterium]
MKRILIILLLLIVSWAKGQENLSVMQAIENALEKNYQIKLIRGNYEVAELQNSWGQAGLYPTFSLNLANNASIQDNTNNPATFFPGVLFSDNLQGSLDMSWTIFSGFGIRINKQRFEKLQEQTAGNAVVVIESTIYDIILAYYTAVVQERKLAVLKSLLQYSKDKLNYYRLKSDLGVSSSIDLLQFENQMLTDSTNVLLQDLSVRNSKRNLNLIMGEDVELLYNLSDSLAFQTPATTYEELKRNMLSNNQNLKNQFMNYELMELDVQTKKSAFYPVVTLRLSTNPSVGYFELFGDQGFSANTNSWSHTATVNLRYDLFQGMNRKRNVQIAEIQRDLAGIEIEQLKMQLSHQLRGNFELYQTRSKVEKISKKRLFHAQQLWDIGKDRYDMGLINIFNLNDIKLSYEQAVLNYYDRLFELLQTHYDLMRLTGRLSQKYDIPNQIDQD